MDQRVSQKEFKKYFGMNENEKKKNMQDVTKETQKIYGPKCLYLKKEKSQINDLPFYLNKLEKT